MVNFTPRLSYPGVRTPYLLNRILDGLESVSGRFGEEKNLFPFPGFEPMVVQPLAIIFRGIGTNTLRKLDGRLEDE